MHDAPSRSMSRARLLIAGLFPAILPVMANGQVSEVCGTMHSLQALLGANPGLAARMAGIEFHTQQAIAGSAAGEDVVYRIPLVVHVVYNNPAANISTAQIQSQIQALNANFRRTIPDASSTIPQFQGVAADCEIEFCLATVDPFGAPTTGITRTPSAISVFNALTNGVKFTSSGGRDAWPTSQYLNIWVCENISVPGGSLVGYAQFPGGPAATDGVVMCYWAFGTTGNLNPNYPLGRVPVHEVGHWLNLRHIWGDAYCGDDFVADTPAQAGPSTGCNTSQFSCGGLNMVQNYMDYSPDTCRNLFTLGQKARMRAQLAVGGPRASLLTSPATCTSGPGPAALYQLNQAAAGLTINGVLATTNTPAVTTVPVGSAATVAFTSAPGGRPFDCLFSPAALVPAGVGAYVTAAGQIVNVNVSAPGTVFLNSGTLAPALLPFASNATVTVNPPVAGTWSAQLLTVGPGNADGFALSQGCQLIATASASCPLTFPAGPTGDDSSVTVALSGPGGCTSPVVFYGTSWTQFHVSSNGRVVFQAPDISWSPSPGAAASGRPFVGFWTDLNPAAAGSIAISGPSVSVVRVAWSGVPYFGEPGSSVSFAIEFHRSSNSVVLDGLLGVNPSPENYHLENQILGISPGAPQAVLSGITTFSVGGSGSAVSPGAMLCDFYDAFTTLGGLVASLNSSLNRIVFAPAGGNYSWAGS